MIAILIYAWAAICIGFLFVSEIDRHPVSEATKVGTTIMACLLWPLLPVMVLTGRRPLSDKRTDEVK